MRQDVNAHGAVVIGGGPAGCAAAILLARAGRDVVLLEKTRAAHDKVCGEFISWEAAHYLRALGLDLRALGAQPIAQLRLFDGEAQLVSTLPFQAWGLSRRHLDEALLDVARAAGASVCRGVGVNHLARDDAGWLLTARGHQYRAPNVFLASGKHDVAGLRRSHAASDLIGFKMHMRLSTPQRAALDGSVEVHLFEDGYAGLEPVDAVTANLCLLVSRRIYNEACSKDWQVLLAWLGTHSSHLRQRLAGAESLWSRPLAVYGTPYGYLHRPFAAEPGLFRLGDQVAVIPSFAGDGIAMALHSAFLAAQAFLGGRDATAYHRQARAAFLRPLRIAGLVSRIALSARGRKSAFLLSSIAPGLVTWGIHGTRLAQQEVLRR